MKPRSPKISSKIRRVLGVDPGRVDTGWAAYELGHGLRYTGVLDGLDHVDAFSITQQYQQWTRLLRATMPDAVCIERYHSQPGRGSGPTLEKMNLAIGVLIALCIKKKLPWILVTASTHKRWLSSNFDVGVIVDKRKQRRGRFIKKKYDIKTYAEWRGLATEHEADAANLAKFGLEKGFTKTT